MIGTELSYVSAALEKNFSISAGEKTGCGAILKEDNAVESMDKPVRIIDSQKDGARESGEVEDFKYLASCLARGYVSDIHINAN